MATYKKFEELEVWQRARELSKEVWSASNRGSFAKDFSLKDQINRASGSIMDNIAEGFGRNGRQEFIQYLSVSKSSADEVESQLYRALDRNHIKDEEFKRLYDQTEAIRNMLGGFIHYLKNTDVKGLKYKSQITNPK